MMEVRTLRHLAAGTALALCCTLTPAVGAPQQAGDQALLGDLIARVAAATGKRFLYQARVKMVKVYGQFPGQDEPDKLWKVFNSVLELNGFAVATVAPGKPHEVNKIVDSRNMRRYPSPTFSAAEIRKNPALLGDVERVVTVTAKLQHTSARRVANALRPLLDPNVGGQIIGIDRAEVIVITEFASNMRRLLRVIELTDVATPAPEMNHAVVALKFAKAAEVAQLLRDRLADLPSREARQAHVLTLDRVEGANGLSLVASVKIMAALREWIAQIDVDPATAGEGK